VEEETRGNRRDNQQGCFLNGNDSLICAGHCLLST
jgi:hypothetical protein